MRYWKFSQKTKLKQKFFAYSEKEVGNFFKTGTIVNKSSNKKRTKKSFSSLLSVMGTLELAL